MKKNKKSKSLKSQIRKKVLMETTKFAVFSKNTKDTERIMRLVGLKVNKNNSLVYKGQVVLCEGCNTSIEKSHLGSVMAKSEHFFCDNPLCFASFIRKHKI